MIKSYHKFSGTYCTSIELATGEEVDLNIGFDYQPYEPPSKSYPGCQPSVGIYEAIVLHPDGSAAEVCLLHEDCFKEDIADALERMTP